MKIKNQKGSVLGTTLIILSIFLAVSLSAVFVANQERRASIGASKSSIAFQAADSGIEAVMQRIVNNRSGTIANIDNTDGQCDGVVNSSGKYKVEFKDSSGNFITDCNTSIAAISRMKSTGYSDQENRALEVLVVSASGSYFTDNFNRSLLGSNWTQQPGDSGTVIINTSIRLAASSTSDAYAYWSANTFTNDQYSQGTLVNVNGSDDTGVTVRASDTTLTLYRFTWYPVNSTWNLNKFSSGSSISLASTGTGPGQTGDVIRITAVGSTITGYVNGTQKLQATDSSISSGYPGVFLGDTNTYLDDWEGGNL